MNTTSDLLALLTSDAFAPVFRSPSQAVHISLCFKGCGGGQCPCDGSIASNDWLATLDSFFSSALAAVNSSGLNVEFLLDGDGNPGQHTCLAHRWRPLQSMYISGPGRDPPGAFTQDDESKGWDRLVVLNEPAGPLWTLAADLHFGKFAARARPFIVWEPSSAVGMLQAVKTYTDSVGAPHAGGFRNAINTDVVTWATHTAPATRRWWRASAPGSKGNASAPRMTPLLSVTRRPGGDNLALALMRSKGGSWTFSTFAFDTGMNAAVPLLLSAGELEYAAAATSLVLGPLSNQSFVAVLSGPSGTATLVVDPMSGDVASGTAYPPVTGVVASAHALHGAEIIELNVVASQSGCALLVTLGRLGAAPAVSACGVAAPLGKLVGVAASLTTFVKGLGSPDLQVGGVVSYASIDGTLFAFTLCAKADYPHPTLRINDPDCFGPPPALPGGRIRPISEWPYAPGTNASLALYVGGASGISLLSTPSGGLDGGDKVNVMILAASSHCANNEPDNKRANIGLCDVPPPRGPGPYIAYMTATSGAFTAALLGADVAWRDSTTGGAGACSSLVATGMITSGASSAPAPSFFSGPRGLEIVALVEGAADMTDSRFCGTTEVSEGDVNILSWPLPLGFL